MVNETSKKKFLPVILNSLLDDDKKEKKKIQKKEKKKIPWHLRDYTYKLLAANEIEASWLDWGKV